MGRFILSFLSCATFSVPRCCAPLSLLVNGLCPLFPPPEDSPQCRSSLELRWDCWHLLAAPTTPRTRSPTPRPLQSRQSRPGAGPPVPLGDMRRASPSPLRYPPSLLHRLLPRSFRGASLPCSRVLPLCTPSFNLS